MKNLKLAAGRADFSRSVIDVSGVKIGGEFVVIAGPCSVESEEQTVRTAIAVKKAGAKMLRGGAFKPRTSPYAVQGLGRKGLKILDKARKEAGKPILLKRGMYSTLEEWLNCAEYILAEGNPNVLLCERGIRTFETYTRNTLDLSMIPAVRKESHLPIFIDPSHGTGILSMIEPMSLAALVAGVDGLEIEVHIDPSCALSDKDQQLSPAQFERLMKKLEATRLFMLELDDKIDSGEMAPAEAKDRGAGGRQGSFPEDAGRGGRKDRMVDDSSGGAAPDRSEIGHFKDSVD
jgi:3-deoxy-7-phosphoheptulonate synthase